MILLTNSQCFRRLLIAFVFCLSVSSVFAQNNSAGKAGGFCARADLFNNGSGVTTLETREMILPVRSMLNVDVKRHGNISVQGSDRSDILVRACVQTWGISGEASRQMARRIEIKMNPIISAENVGADKNVWNIANVSYEIYVPRSINLYLSTWNGNISIADVQGVLQFKALNGNIFLRNPAGNVRGRTTNGNVGVELAGTSWTGEWLDVETSNGGIDLSIPEKFAANLEIGTGSGTFDSNVSGLQSDKQNQAVRFNRALNGGGAFVRVITGNGSVSVNRFGK